MPVHTKCESNGENAEKQQEQNLFDHALEYNWHTWENARVPQNFYKFHLMQKVIPVYHIRNNSAVIFPLMVM